MNSRARQGLQRPCSIYKLSLQFNASKEVRHKHFLAGNYITPACVGWPTDKEGKPGIIDGA